MTNPNLTPGTFTYPSLNGLEGLENVAGAGFLAHTISGQGPRRVVDPFSHHFAPTPAAYGFKKDSASPGSCWWEMIDADGLRIVLTHLDDPTGLPPEDGSAWMMGAYPAEPLDSDYLWLIVKYEDGRVDFEVGEEPRPLTEPRVLPGGGLVNAHGEVSYPDRGGALPDRSARITLTGDALRALIRDLREDPDLPDVYKLTVAREGDDVKFKVNEDMWSQPYAIRP